MLFESLKKKNCIFTFSDFKIYFFPQCCLVFILEKENKKTHFIAVKFSFSCFFFYEKQRLLLENKNKKIFSILNTRHN